MVSANRSSVTELHVVWFASRTMAYHVESTAEFSISVRPSAEIVKAAKMHQFYHECRYFIPGVWMAYYHRRAFCKCQHKIKMNKTKF